MSNFLTPYKNVVVTMDNIVQLFIPGMLFIAKNKNLSFVQNYQIKTANGLIMHATESNETLTVGPGDAIMVCGQAEDVVRNTLFFQCFITKIKTGELVLTWLEQGKLKELYEKNK
jgi:hypothetical protein